jgi:hypothetical protein
MSFRFVVWGITAVVAAGCGHAAKLRPTAPGQVSVEAALGGPMAEVEGLTVPLPLTTLGASVGLNERFDLGLHAHGTSLAFGVAGLDVGSTWLALDGQGAIPTVALNAKLYAFLEVRRFVPAGYLELGGTASWKLGPVSPYLHLAALGRLGGPPLPAVGGGLQLDLGRFSLQAEARWYQPLYDTRFVVVEWLHVGGHGAWGPMVAMSYRFGGEP